MKTGGFCLGNVFLAWFGPSNSCGTTYESHKIPKYRSKLSSSYYADCVSLWRGLLPRQWVTHATVFILCSYFRNMSELYVLRWPHTITRSQSNFSICGKKFKKQLRKLAIENRHSIKGKNGPTKYLRDGHNILTSQCISRKINIRQRM